MYLWSPSFDIIDVLTHFCILNQYINSNVNYQMATVGYLIGESTPTIGYGMDVHHTIANNELADLPIQLTLPLFLAINFAEAFRASKGWVNPKEGSLFTLNDGYYPGDLGFDPFGLKPTDAKEFTELLSLTMAAWQW